MLARISGIDVEHNHVPALRQLLKTAGADQRATVHLQFALHHELHALGDYAGAWRALEAGCRIQRQFQPYDLVDTARLFRGIRELCDRDFVQGKDFVAPLQPIFIIGMHRSGTTLLERMLGGHPDVADAGETYAFPAQLKLASDHFFGGAIDQTVLERATHLDFEGIGRGFVDAMGFRASARPFVTEKFNPNFIVAGLVAKALPHSRFLHLRRDPVATCFSNLRTLFTLEAAYSYDQCELADFFAMYHQLMSHWHDVMPGRILDVDYSGLVADPQAHAVVVAAHCGLVYRSEMLDVARPGGMVSTASAQHVRGGILGGRDEAWKHYEAKLEPLLDGLARHGLH